MKYKISAANSLGGTFFFQEALSTLLTGLFFSKKLRQSDFFAFFAQGWINNQILAAVKTRTEEEAQRQVGIVKQARQQDEADYPCEGGLINALVLINGDAAYATFIDHVNVLIDRQKTVLKTRKTVNAKKKGNNSDQPVIEPAG